MRSILDLEMFSAGPLFGHRMESWITNLTFKYKYTLYFRRLPHRCRYSLTLSIFVVKGFHHYPIIYDYIQIYCYVTRPINTNEWFNINFQEKKKIYDLKKFWILRNGFILHDFWTGHNAERQKRQITKSRNNSLSLSARFSLRCPYNNNKLIRNTHSFR